MDTKDKIARTALRLFLEKGYEKTSLNDIAHQVGITKPAIYHHFKNKDQLFQQVLTLFFEEMGNWSSSRLGSCRNLKDLLKTLFGSLKAFQEVTGIILGQHQRKAPYSFLELFLAASKKDPRIQKRIENGFIITRRFLKEKLQEAQKKREIRSEVDCETLSFEIHALIEGTGLISYLDHSINIERLGEKMFNHMWKMLRR
jgi:AcrR family transcriptional regulator